MIDQLTSLKAYEKVEAPTRKMIANLIEKEDNGMQVLAGFHDTTRAMEYQRLGETTGDAGVNVALYNGLKGYVPSTVEHGHAIVVMEDSEHEYMINRGYERIGKYNGTVGRRGTSSYYQSSVAGKNNFRQGAAQTVHATWNGVDVRTGFTKSPDIAGVITAGTARVLQKEISKGGLRNNLAPGEHAIPVFDANGDVHAYQMTMDPKVTAALPKDTNLSRMLGVWAGRIVEERMSDQFNSELIGIFKEMHDKLGTKEADQFVNVADPKAVDPVIRDAWNTLGWKIKADAAEIFGRENFLPIRRDMVDDGIGYRKAGVTDAWTGVTRLPPVAVKVVRDLSMLITGKNGYKYLKKTEGVAQDLVSFSKSNIIVRTIDVITKNMHGNVFQLITHGINPVKLVKGMRDAFVEITTYTKNEDEIRRLGVHL